MHIAYGRAGTMSSLANEEIIRTDAFYVITDSGMLHYHKTGHSSLMEAMNRPSEQKHWTDTNVMSREGACFKHFTKYLEAIMYKEKAGPESWRASDRRVCPVQPTSRSWDRPRGPLSRPQPGLARHHGRTSRLSALHAPSS